MATDVFKLIGPNRATFNMIDTAGVASLELDGVPVTGVSTGDQTITGVKTFASDVTLGAGTTVDVDSAAVAATGNDTTQTATVTKYAGTITTGALTTAANAATSVVLTLTGVAAGKVVLVTGAGGTNTTPVYVQSAVTTSNTVTVVLRNGVNATTALNGTVAFHYWVLN